MADDGTISSQYLSWNQSSTLVACSAEQSATFTIVDVASRSVYRRFALGGACPLRCAALCVIANLEGV